MKLLFKFSIGLVLLSSLLIGCKTAKLSTTTETPAAIVKEQNNASSLLWKIEGNGIKPSYLFGTVHILKQQDFVLKQHVKDAFTEVEQIVLEVDMDDPNMQMEMMQSAIMKDGVTLDQLIDEKTYEALDAKLTKSLGIGVQMFNTWQPMLLTSLLLTDIVGEQPASFEGTLVEMAKAQEKEVLGLETIAEQLNFFHDIPYKEQATMILDYLNKAEEMEQSFSAMTGHYLSENIDALYNYIMEESKKQNFNTTSLVDKRNENWIPQIKAIASEKSSFFGVGAGHLGGTKGVVKLLKAAGFTVSPVVE